MPFDYDLFVIGGGSGGVRAARLASGECGAKVGLAEEYRMGGTCVIRGCVPKKLMVFASEYAEMFEHARAFGWELGLGAFSWDRFSEKMRSELDRLEAIYRKVLAEAAVETFDARATLADPHTVKLATGERFTAKHILLANGGHPTLPDLPNAELGITSADIFLMKELPKSILIVGGGYIACEFAGILNGMGVEVTQFYRGAQVLRGFDEEARGVVAEGMREKGVDLHVGTNVLGMKKSDDGIWVKSTTGMERAFDKVMFATGRTANTAEMGLEEIGVKMGRKGEILVDAYSQTAVPSIYAIGDVTDRIALTPVAIREGVAFVETVFKGNPTKPDHELVPSAIFTQPEMGTIGLSEEDAAEKGADRGLLHLFQADAPRLCGLR